LFGWITYCPLLTAKSCWLTFSLARGSRQLNVVGEKNVEGELLRSTGLFFAKGEGQGPEVKIENERKAGGSQVID
jgi:hypothetical protein